jgi:dipeptidyl aminopeptidase/acylaminoacyl peptidase
VGSDWATIYAEPSRQGLTRYLFGGRTPYDDLALYFDRSPIGCLQQAKTPMLIVYGERDRTAAIQAEELYAGLASVGDEVVCVTYHERGTRSANRSMLSVWWSARWPGTRVIWVW